MTWLSSVYGLVGVNSKCGVQSKRRSVCIVGFSACGTRFTESVVGSMEESFEQVILALEATCMCLK